jgi:hypothetical protein
MTRWETPGTPMRANGIVGKIWLNKACRGCRPLDGRSRLVKADCVRRLVMAFGSLCRQGGARGRVATSLVSLHVAAHAKGFATSRLRALVGLLACVTVAVDAQAAWPREGLVASRADVAVLGLRKLRLAGSADVVVVLPWVGAVGSRAGHRCRQWHGMRLEVGRKRTLRIHWSVVVGVLFGRVEGCRRGSAR